MGANHYPLVVIFCPLHRRAAAEAGKPENPSDVIVFVIAALFWYGIVMCRPLCIFHICRRRESDLVFSDADLPRHINIIIKRAIYYWTGTLEEPSQLFNIK